MRGVEGFGVYEKWFQVRRTVLQDHCHIVTPVTVYIKTNTSTFPLVGELCVAIRSEKLEACQLQCRVRYRSTQPWLREAENRSGSEVSVFPQLQSTFVQFVTQWMHIGEKYAWQQSAMSALTNWHTFLSWRLLHIVLTKVSTPLTKMSNKYTDELMKVENKCSGVVALMFRSSSLVKELLVTLEKTVLANKTIQKQSAPKHWGDRLLCHLEWNRYSISMSGMIVLNTELWRAYLSHSYHGVLGGSVQCVLLCRWHLLLAR